MPEVTYMNRTLNKINKIFSDYDTYDNNVEPQAIVGVNTAIYHAVSHLSAPNVEVINHIYRLCVEARNEYERTKDIEPMKKQLEQIRKSCNPHE